MNIILITTVLVIMLAMSVVPLFAVMYFANERSPVGPVLLAAALVCGALLGTTLSVTP